MKMHLACALVVCAATLAAAKPQGPFNPRPAGPPPPPRPPFGAPPPRPAFGGPVGPVGPGGPFVPIVNQNFDINGVDGSYTFGYESGDGSTRQETGVVNNPGTPVEAMAVTGSYSYIGTDGVPVTVNYVADEFGFQPVGNDIHPAIQRAVADQVAFARSQPPPPPGAFAGAPAGPGPRPRFPPPPPPPRPF